MKRVKSTLCACLCVLTLTTTACFDENAPPDVVAFAVSTTAGEAPLTVEFSWTVFDRDGDPVQSKIDVNGDGVYELMAESRTPEPVSYALTFTFAEPGAFSPVLELDDGSGRPVRLPVEGAAKEGDAGPPAKMQVVVAPRADDAARKGALDTSGQLAFTETRETAKKYVKKSKKGKRMKKPGTLGDAGMMGEDGEELVLFPPFVTVPRGAFVMGTPPGELAAESDETQHGVTLTAGFEIMEHEATQAEFEALMDYNPSRFDACGSTCPVENVTWHDALAFANALSDIHGIFQCFDCVNVEKTFPICALKTQYARPQDCLGYRLPTESEWEYAARAGATTAFPNGPITNGYCSDANLNLVAWYCGTSLLEWTTHPVERLAPNAWGLFDVSGNVNEWVWDWYGPYPGSVTDPLGPASGNRRAIRGGSWGNGARSCRLGNRGAASPFYYNDSLGFRLVRTLL